LRAVEPRHTVRLEYCVACNYLGQALTFAEDTLSRWGAVIKSFELTPTGWGTFEVTVNDELVFSAWALGRYQKPGELMELLEQRLGPPLEYQYDHAPEPLDEHGYPVRGADNRRSA
jgi:selT/selW/selH-like putative selenoprotein